MSERQKRKVHSPRVYINKSWASPYQGRCLCGWQGHRKLFEGTAWDEALKHFKGQVDKGRNEEHKAG